MGNSNFCKIADGNHEEATGIPAFLNPEIARIFTRGEKTLLRGHIVLISEDRDVKMINILIAHEVSKSSVGQNGDYDYKKVAIFLTPDFSTFLMSVILLVLCEI